mgnify:CR=1 FL=1
MHFFPQLNFGFLGIEQPTSNIDAVNNVIIVFMFIFIIMYVYNNIIVPSVNHINIENTQEDTYESD